MTVFSHLCLVNFLARFSYALARNPVLPLFALFLGAGPEAIGLAVGVSTVTGIVFKLPAGALSDIVGRRRTMLAGLVFFGLMPYAYLFVESYQALVAVRFVHGLATAIYAPVAMAVVASLAGDRKGELLSLFSSVAIIGTLLGAPIGGLVLHNPFVSGEPGLGLFRLVYLLSGLTGLAALVLGVRSLGQGGQEPEGAGQGLAERGRLFVSGLRTVAGDRRVLAASSMEAIQNLAMGALEAFLPIYAVTVAGLTAFQAGLLWGVQVTAIMAAKPLMGRISDRRGRRPLIVAGLALCAGPLAAIPHLTGFWSLLAACLAFGLGEALVTSSAAALVADCSRQRHLGSAMGVFGTIADVGHASGPILAGALVGGLGYGAGFAILAAVLLGAIPWYVRAARQG
jgi:MFS family permease